MVSARRAALAALAGAAAACSAPATGTAGPGASASPGLISATSSSALTTSTGAASPAPATAGPPATADPAFLPAHRAEHDAALARARAWLDTVHVDPIALRAMGIKGKKKLGEILHCYVRLWTLAKTDAERAALKAKMADAVRVADDPAFHDVATVDEATLREDATSYLRIPYLMDKVGLDTARYRAEILKVVPRLNAHIATRGVHQREAFALYYDHFGIPFPDAYRTGGGAGVIATHPDPRAVGRNDAYQITHEVFVPYDFGFLRDPSVPPFSDADRAWLRAALPVLIARFMAAGELDIVSELTSSTGFLGYADLAAYATAVAWLLAHQNADGSWGDYSALRPRFSDEDLKYRLVLHTTMVTIDALVSAFD